MNFWYAFGTLGLTAFLYWAAYQSNKLMKTVELKGNLLLNVPEFIFKLIIFGLCLGIASSLDVSRPAISSYPNGYFGWPSGQPAVDVVEGAALGLVIQFVVNIGSTIAVRVFGPDIYSPTIMKGIVPQNTRQWLLIIPPLLLAVAIEEMLFRALLVGGFSTVVSPWIMAVATSIVFGLMHAPQGRLGIVVTGIVGFVFATIFILTNSLVLVICTHYIINFIQIARAKEDVAWFEKFQQKRTEERLAATRAARANAMELRQVIQELNDQRPPEERASVLVGTSEELEVWRKQQEAKAEASHATTLDDGAGQDDNSSRGPQG